MVTYNRDNLEIKPQDTELLETWVVFWKYVDWFAEYKLKRPKWKGKRHKVRRVLVWTWFNLKMYIQPPVDELPEWIDEGKINIMLGFDLYTTPIVWSENLVMKIWNWVHESLRDEILEANDITIDKTLFRF